MGVASPKISSSHPEPNVLLSQLLSYGQALHLFAKHILQRHLDYLLITCFCLPETYLGFLQ